MMRRAAAFERAQGSGSAADKAEKVLNHTQERAAYYDELKSMMDVPMAKAAPFGPVPTVPPIGGSSPRAETPTLPDFHALYFQPEDAAAKKKRAREALEARKAADAKRAAGVSSFHGDGRVLPEPTLRFVPAKKPRSKREVRVRMRSPQDVLNALYGPAKKSEVLLADLLKATGHKYTRRVPYTDAKGRRRYRYFYAESASVRAATTRGEQVRLGGGMVTVRDVLADGSVVVELAGGGTKRVDDWGAFVASYYPDRYQTWAVSRAQRTINAVRRHVPAALLRDLPGDDDVARLKALEQRAPEVYARLQKAFRQSGIGPLDAQRVVEQSLRARGWEPDARAALMGSVLERKNGPKRITEVIRAAENLSGGSRVTPGHVQAVTELTGGLKDSGAGAMKLEGIAAEAKQRTARLEEAIAEARKGDGDAKAAAMAAAVSDAAIQQMAMVAKAFPGMDADVASRVMDLLREAGALKPGKPKTDGAEAVLFVAGEDGRPRRLRARYKLVGAADAKASHDPSRGFAKRDDYPEGVQERAYHRDRSEQAKVIRNAQKLEPSIVINTNPDATNGPPMMTADGVVLGGNSRTMSIQAAYADHPDSAAAYRKHLKENAAAFGFSAEDIAAIENPMLVRVVEPEGEPEAGGLGLFGESEPKPRAHTKEEMRLLVRQMNETFTQAMDPRTMAVAMGRKLSDKTLETFANGMGPDDTLASFLTSSRSNDFIAALRRDGILDARNLNQYTNPKGRELRLNEDGKTLITRILMGRVVDDADTLSNTQPSTVAAIARAVPALLKAKAFGAGYDLSEDLATAVHALNTMRAKAADGTIKEAPTSKLKPAEFQQLYRAAFPPPEESLFGGVDDRETHPITASPRAQLILEALVAKPGPVQLAKIFEAHAALARVNQHTSQAELGGVGAKSKPPLDVFQEIIDDQVRKTAPEPPKQQSLLGGTAEKSVRASDPLTKALDASVYLACAARLRAAAKR